MEDTLGKSVIDGAKPVFILISSRGAQGHQAACSCPVTAEPHSTRKSGANKAQRWHQLGWGDVPAPGRRGRWPQSGLQGPLRDRSPGVHPGVRVEPGICRPGPQGTHSSTRHVLLPGPFLVAPSRAVRVTHHNCVGVWRGLPPRGAVTPGDSAEKARLRRKGEGT